MTLKRKQVCSDIFLKALNNLASLTLSKVEYNKTVYRFKKTFDESHKEFYNLYKKYIELGDEGKNEIEQLIDEEVELKLLPQAIWNDPKLDLCARDLGLLECIFDLKK